MSKIQKEALEIYEGDPNNIESMQILEDAFGEERAEQIAWEIDNCLEMV